MQHMGRWVGGILCSIKYGKGAGRYVLCSRREGEGGRGNVWVAKDFPIFRMFWFSVFCDGPHEF